MLRAGFALVVLAGLAVPATAAPPSPDPKSLAVSPEELSKARELVRQLGSEVFVEREDAEHNLAAMGRSARAALLDGANYDPDPEIRSRCRGLLPRATAIEMQARLDTFLADTDGKFEHDLPGWNKLRATVRGEWAMFGWTFVPRPGSDKAAREMFVEFLKAPGGRQLLTAIGNGGSDLGAMVAAMKQDLYYAKYPRTGGVSPRNPSTSEVAVVMFADSLSKSSTGVRNTLFTSVLQTSGVTQAANGTDEKSAAMLAILTAWFDTRTEAYEMYSALNIASGLPNTEVAVRLAVRLANTKGAPGLYRGQALATLVRLESKGKEHLPLIEKLIGDETMITRIGGVNGKIQTIVLGDMALAAAVTTTGQKLEDYFIDDRFKGSGAASVSYTRYSIPEEKRKEAAEKWKAWREKNP